MMHGGHAARAKPLIRRRSFRPRASPPTLPSRCAAPATSKAHVWPGRWRSATATGCGERPRRVSGVRCSSHGAATCPIPAWARRRPGASDGPSGVPSAAADPARGPHRPEGSGGSGQLSRRRRAGRERSGHSRAAARDPARGRALLARRARGIHGDTARPGPRRRRRRRRRRTSWRSVPPCSTPAPAVAMVDPALPGRRARRPPAPARQLDAAWLAVVAELRRRVAVDSLVVGGRPAAPGSPAVPRSRPARTGILALAFPLHPPGRPEVPGPTNCAPACRHWCSTATGTRSACPSRCRRSTSRCCRRRTHALSKAPQRLARSPWRSSPSLESLVEQAVTGQIGHTLHTADRCRSATSQALPVPGGRPVPIQRPAAGAGG